ncbi:amino acid adenylation domain-containing protein [Amycolatopsis keratiniphila]|uniref:Amino acid adenylation domain-containing protein n=1 Tax=Amycolatopsis keratiniphila subsp. keratiniphila TaxID=227715 RepID=A0A1W2LSJ4_9PSEU|nr:amino acid adenylation domain-containing protein [Amycolatopsis keratiniphila]ONF67865.1 hypothetical protein AVR91_0220675 [Amycolatopsis keratiniphila subsp. keratiniphila]
MSDNRTLGDELRATAVQLPGATAITDGTVAWTYAELDSAAAGIAKALAECGVRPGDCVVWHGRKTISAVAAVHGILRADAAFVPVDPEGPISRAALIVEQTQPRALVADSVTRRKWESLLPDLRWRILTDEAEPAGELWVAEPGAGSREPVPGLAYVLHTSGSTGRPKGVMHTQASARAFLDWAVAELKLGPEDVLLSSSPLHFDPSTLHLFGAARVGAAVALPPPAAVSFPLKYLEFCRDTGTTIIYAVTSTMAWLARRGRDLLPELRSVRAVVFGGEVMRPVDMNVLLAGVPRARFLNVYGPTESNVCTTYEIPTAQVAADAVIPIGRALPGTEIAVVDEELKPVPTGVSGELLVRGPTLMTGYLDGTAEAFVVTADGRDWYPTGDLVLRNDSGELEFLGRRDGQIKVSGYRVELGEVERHLSALCGVRECAAVAVSGEDAATVIVAFVNTARPSDAKPLHELLREYVPAYMVPERIVTMSTELPKLTNGKVDRQSLADLARLPARDREKDLDEREGA